MWWVVFTGVKFTEVVISERVIYSQKELNPSVRGMSPYVRQGNTVLVNDYFLGGHIIIKKTTK